MLYSPIVINGLRLSTIAKVATETVKVAIKICVSFVFIGSAFGLFRCLPIQYGTKS
jgi:hypothetical protein